MTEQEWLVCTDPQKMLEFLRGRSSERKLRLFAVACCRWVDGLVAEVRGQNAVEAAERYADGGVTSEDLATARKGAVMEAKLDRAGNLGWCWDIPEWPTVLVVSASLTLEEAAEAACGAVLCATHLERLRHRQPADTRRTIQADLLRNVFGNPFRPVRINTAWLSSTVSMLATAAYQERALPSGELDPARLCILADALEEAGCEDVDILGHLRSPGPHVRGCWSLDLLLERE
jgi:hypothetical protein